MLKQETFDDGKLTFILTFDDFVEIAGTWWARHMVQTNEQGQTIADTRIEISALTPDDYTHACSNSSRIR